MNDLASGNPAFLSLRLEAKEFNSAMRFALIKHALSSLLSHKQQDGFVVIEHVQSGKFVQFAGSASEMLLLDLPLQALSDVERHRAIEFFRHRGIIAGEHVLLDEPDGNVVGRQRSFNVRFQSEDEAAKTAVDIFQAVFNLPCDCRLSVTEN